MENDSKVAAKMVEEGIREIIIREGDALTIREKLKVEVSGNIKAPADFFLNRKELLDEKKCHVTYSKTDTRIVLTTDENNYYGSRITGSLLLNPELVALGINKNKIYTPQELSQLLKMSRFFFADSDNCMTIVENLSKAKASATSQIEKEKDSRGNEVDNFSVKIDSNIKLNFNLLMPLFVGYTKHKFDVEICLDVRSRSISLWLESVELKELIHSETEKIMNTEIARFGKIICIEQ